jgi:hypothetical protein
MRNFVVVVIVLLTCPHVTRSMCYLTGDDCPICFITPSGESDAAASYCPEGIDLEFETVPDSPMISFETYNVAAVLTLNTSKVNLVSQIVGDHGDVYDLSHTNVHSCISKNGVCTPFISNTPSLATHTNAIAMNITEPSDPTNEPGISRTRIEALVSLTEEQYQIIFHVRMFRVENGMTYKYDIAAGITRTVRAPQKEKAKTSTGAIVSVAACAAVVLVGLSFLEYKVYKGTFSWDIVMETVGDEYFINIARGMIKIFGIAVWTIFFLNSIYEDDELVNLVPLGTVALLSGWTFTIFAIGVYFRNIYTRYSDSNNKNISVRDKTQNQFIRDLRIIKLDFFGLLIESLPLTVCLVWSMLILERVDIISIIALSLSMMDLGVKFMSVKDFSVTKTKIRNVVEIEALENEIIKHSNNKEDGQKAVRRAKRNSITAAMNLGVTDENGSTSSRNNNKIVPEQGG